MKRPKLASITIRWVDSKGDEHYCNFSEASLEEAYDLIGLMIGEINEEDLKS